MYRDPEGATKPVGSLIRACKQGLPVHLILGGVNDFMFVAFSGITLP